MCYVLLQCAIFFLVCAIYFYNFLVCNVLLYFFSYTLHFTTYCLMATTVHYILFGGSYNALYILGGLPFCKYVYVDYFDLCCYLCFW